MMRIGLRVITALGCVSASINGAAQFTVNQPIPPTASVVVDTSRSAGSAVPRTIFGSFLEPIGNSTYNGLWAEVLQNPSLESGLWSASNVERMVHDEPALV